MRTPAKFPAYRPRRLRGSPRFRALVAETRLDPGKLVAPLFVDAKIRRKTAIASMPGVFRFSLEEIAGEAKALAGLGVGAALLFGIPPAKDSKGSGAFARDGIVQRAVGRIKKAAPGLVVMTDVCLCEYTSHGHCGVVKGAGVDNDATLALLAKIALSQARAGADLVAPSAMMDGQVAAIRKALDGAGFAQVPIMSYSAKYASALYGPFREAVESAPRFGDRRGYQMDPPNLKEALREVALDIQEGADLVMVKPAMGYLDVIQKVKEEFHWPTAAYQVSGEYALIKAAAQRGWVQEKRLVMESLTSIRRSGADLIITYYAKEIARWIKEKGVI
ncbi:MAG: porphobilinogen synthase [Candidatus Omnitrophica bacterium]|nr:porphobilinogen synthase [Candidatus Omnitrophota bacterium]